MVWEEKKNNRIGHETKRIKWDFCLGSTPRRETTRFGSSLQSFCKVHKSRKKLWGFDSCCEVKKRKKALPQCEYSEEQNIVWKEEETTVSVLSVCESKEKHRDFFFNCETYTREINLRFLKKDIVIEFIIIYLSRVCPVIFLFKVKEFSS